MDGQASPVRRTATVGGLLLIATAVVWIIAVPRFGVLQTLRDVDFAEAAASVLLLTAMITLSFGVRGDAGVFGSSRLVVAAAIAFGARSAAFWVSDSVVARATAAHPGSFALILVSLALNCLFAAAVILVACAQTVAGRASGLVLIALWTVAGANLLISSSSFVGTVSSDLFLARAHAELLLPLCLAFLGIAYVLRGSHSSVTREQARRITDASSSADPALTPGSSD